MKEDFRFSCPIRVRYSEIDGQKIVYNSRYLEYLDVALTEYVRQMGIPYPEMVERHGCDPSLVKANLEFRRPVYFDELLEVYARVSEMGRTSFTMDFEIYKEKSETLVLVAQVVYVNYDPGREAARPLPESVRAAIEGFEGRTWR